MDPGEDWKKFIINPSNGLVCAVLNGKRENKSARKIESRNKGIDSEKNRSGNPDIDKQVG